MGAARTYIREQFRLNKLTLEHAEASDFYRGSWQSGYSAVPLLCFRFVLFLGCLGILITSLVTLGPTMGFRYWPIYMTHWGVVFITIASGCAFFVSVMAYAKRSLVSDKLPWYVKLYWAIFSVALILAFFITVFYYIFLFGEVSPEDDKVLDVFVHAVNSVVMLLLLVTARHPLHLLHFIYPLVAALIYMLFSLIYYYAGGTNPIGGSAIYPILDWSNPGPTVGLVFGAMAALLVIHILAMAISFLRTYLTRRFVAKKISLIT